MKKEQIKRLVFVALTGALVVLLAKTTRFPPFPQAAYLKLEFGEIPLLLLLMLGSVSMSMEALLLKELLSLFLFGTNFLALIADFVACGAFLLAYSCVWKKGGGIQRILLATAVGAAVRMLVAIPDNLIILPLQYGTPLVGVWAQMVFILPFNALKCLLDGACILALYPRLERPLERYFTGMLPQRPVR